MRYTWLIPLAIFAFATAAQAQVAAPRLNSLAIDSSRVTPHRAVKPFNPAVLPWSGFSRIGLGIADLEGEDLTGLSEGDGKFLQGRFVGETFAIAAEAYQAELTTPGSEIEFDGAMVAAALQFGGLLSVGIGQQTGDFNFISGGNPESFTLPQVGATLRIGELLYLGFATGDETVDKGGAQGEADRTVTNFGAGYHFREDDRGFHIEAYKVTVDGIDDPVFGTEDEVDSTAITVEVVFSNILIGYEGMSTDKMDPTTGTVNLEVDLSGVSVGWVPMEGLTVVAGKEKEETTDPTTGTVLFTIELTTVGVAWAF